MRIIKPGKINTNINICPYCECQYEYDDTDVMIYYGYGLNYSQYAYVCCPTCHRINKINNYSIGNNWGPLNVPIVSYDDCNASKKSYMDTVSKEE